MLSSMCAAIYLLCQMKLRSESHTSESLYRYCIEACSDGWSDLRSWRKSHITTPQTSAAKIGYVCDGAVMPFLSAATLAMPMRMREKRYSTI